MYGTYWASEASPTRGVQSIFRVISKSGGSTLYVGLSGIVRNLIQKSTGMGSRMSRASDNTKDAMKKKIWRIHSVSLMYIHDLLVFLHFFQDEQG